MSHNLLGEYEVGNLIGKGSFSKIYKAFHPQKNITYALKRIQKKNLKNTKIVIREVSVMRKLEHPNILKLFDVLVTKRHFYLILEYCGKGDLKKYIKGKPRSEKFIGNILNQIKSGLEYMYQLNIIHRDLKPQNILVDQDEVIKISDFGFAKVYNNDELSETICGSPLYMSPEMLNYKSYTDKADLWSVGVIMYELFTKKMPYTGDNIYHMVQNLKKYKFEPPDIHLSCNTVELLSHLLIKNPKARISWEDFFIHPFFKVETRTRGSSFDTSLIFNLEMEDTAIKDVAYLVDSKYGDSEMIEDREFNVSTNYNIHIKDHYLEKSIPFSPVIKELNDSNFLLLSSGEKKKYTHAVPKSMPNHLNSFLNKSFKSLKKSFSSLYNNNSF